MRRVGCGCGFARSSGETEDAASVVFEVPADGFTYRPGQFITVGAQLADGIARAVLFVVECARP